MTTTIKAFEDDIMNDHRTAGIAIFVFELDKYKDFIDEIPLDNIPTVDVKVQRLPKPLHRITKFLACIDNEGEHFIQTVDAMRAEVFAVLDAFRKVGARSVAMSSIKVNEIPDKSSRPEAYQRQYVEEYVASHPDAFDTICLVDLHGGFNHC